MAVEKDTATILSGASLSDVVELNDSVLAAIETPAAMTGTSFTFQGSFDKQNFFNVYDDSGVEVSVTSAASRFIIINSPSKFLGMKFLKIRSGTSGAPTAEGADRAINIYSVK